jgi:hypothetical protein
MKIKYIYVKLFKYIFFSNSIRKEWEANIRNANLQEVVY